MTYPLKLVFIWLGLGCSMLAEPIMMETARKTKLGKGVA